MEDLPCREDCQSLNGTSAADTVKLVEEQNDERARRKAGRTNRTTGAGSSLSRKQNRLRKYRLLLHRIQPQRKPNRLRLKQKRPKHLPTVNLSLIVNHLTTGIRIGPPTWWKRIPDD